MASKKPPMKIDDMWAITGKAFTEILTNTNKGISNKEYMALYTVVFDFVSSMNAENGELYKRFTELLRSRTQELVAIAKPLPDEEVLLFFVQKWDEWAAVMKMINHLMAYMNRTWVKNQRTSGSTGAVVYEIGMTGDIVWKDHMLVGGLKERLAEAMHRLVKQDRDGNKIQEHLIRNCLNCFVRMGLNKENPAAPTLDVYKQHFEGRFLKETEVYYTGEALRVLEQSGVCAYMKQVETRLAEEERRVERFLHACTQKPLIECVEKVMITQHKEAMHSRFVDLLRSDAGDDLRRMYDLLKRVEGGLEPLRNQYEEFVRQAGLDAIAAEKQEATEKPEVFVNILLRVFRKYTDLIANSFRSDPGFVLALDKAFRDFVNKNSVTEEDSAGASGEASAKAPQILAKYCDSILRKGSTVSDDEMERTQSDVVSLFKFFPDKDVFMLVYSKLLSRRLINEQSASEEVESAMIAKLKAAQGFEYTMKLGRMITDMTVSKDINRDFQEFCVSSNVQLPFSFNVFVLATGSWPLQAPPTNFHVPEAASGAMDAFKTFYDKKYQGRKLNYLHHLSRAEVDMKPAKGRYRLMTTTYQMGILMMFADAEGAISFHDIQTHTMLQDPLRMNLWPLVKLKILDCSEGLSVDKWTDATTFTFNPKFANKKARLQTIPGPGIPGLKEGGAAKEGGQKVDEETAEIMRDRVLKLQAAIVRVMKARKTLSHNELMQETIDQVSKWFAPKVPHIKKAIESLIEQEFIKRSKDLKSFEYIA